MSVSAVGRRWVRQAGEPFSQGLSYLASLPELWTTVLVGGLLWGYGVWLGPLAVVVMGFYLQVLKHVPPSPEYEDVTPIPAEPPRFHRWTTLVFDGVRAYVVWMGYLLFAFAGAISAAGEENAEELFVAVFGAFLGNAAFILNVRNAVGASELQQSSIGLESLYSPATLLLVVAMYLAPAALLNVAARGRLTDGFDFAAIRPIIWSPAYLGRWLVFVALWAVATAALYFPAGYALFEWFPEANADLLVVLRESTELLRGFVSFGLLLLGYAILGRVSVPPTDRLSADRLRSFLYGSRLRDLAENRKQFGRTLLVLGIVTSFWSLPAAVLLVGYLSRFVRAVGGSRPPPVFDDIVGLLRDGLRGVAVWALYGAIPIVSLSVWYALTPVFWEAWLEVTVAGLTGAPFAAFYLGRDVYFAVQPAYGFAAWDETPWLVVAAVSTPVALYLLPAAFVLGTRARRLGAAFDPRRLAATVLRPTYLRDWLAGMALVFAGTVPVLWWNDWQSSAGGSHSAPLVQYGLVTLVEVPTADGLVGSAALLAVSVVSVLCVLRSWELFTRGVGGDSTAPTTTEGVDGR